MKIVDTKEILRVFADELNKRMEDKGVTLKQVVLASRASQANMYNYKRGIAFPELRALVLIADYLECSMDELLGYRSGFKGRSDLNRPTNEKEFADYFRLRLIEFMRVRSVDAEELASRSDISAKTIDMYLSIHRWLPRVPELLRICSALDCTPTELLGY